MRCKKKWDPISFKLDPNGIRPMIDVGGRLLPDKAGLETPREQSTYAKWGDKVPGLAVFAGRLPQWPRWARVLVALALLGVIIGVIVLLRR